MAAVPTKTNNQLLDAYTVKARYYPALLVFMAPSIALSVLAPDMYTTTGGIVLGVATYCGGTVLLANLGRDQGKTKEPKLFSLWGGPPSHVKLSQFMQRDTLGNLHKGFNQHLPHLNLVPGNLMEDAAIDECVALLRAQTRDKKKYPLIFEENCNYGFRRNTWGLKTIGATFCVLTLFAAAATLGYRYYTAATIPTAPELFALVIVSLCSILWLFWFTPRWVKIAGEAYADRLLEACKDL